MKNKLCDNLLVFGIFFASTASVNYPDILIFLFSSMESFRGLLVPFILTSLAYSVSIIYSLYFTLNIYISVKLGNE